MTGGGRRGGNGGGGNGGRGQLSLKAYFQPPATSRSPAAARLVSGLWTTIGAGAPAHPRPNAPPQPGSALDRLEPVVQRAVPDTLVVTPARAAGTEPEPLPVRDELVPTVLLPEVSPISLPSPPQDLTSPPGVGPRVTVSWQETPTAARLHRIQQAGT